jgi:hypothetical protein
MPKKPSDRPITKRKRTEQLRESGWLGFKINMGAAMIAAVFAV